MGCPDRTASIRVADPERIRIARSQRAPDRPVQQAPGALGRNRDADVLISTQCLVSPRYDYASDIAALGDRVMVLVGDDDEANDASAYAPLFIAAGSGAEIEILPGVITSMSSATPQRSRGSNTGSRI